MSFRKTTVFFLTDVVDRKNIYGDLIYAKTLKLFNINICYKF